MSDGCSRMVWGYGSIEYSDKTSRRLKPRALDSQGRVVAYNISDEQLLLRFLITGSEVGNFYATAHELTEENVECVGRLIRGGQGEWVVEKVVDVVRRGRCIRLNTALLVLALCCRSDDAKTKLAAYKAVVEVCNIPTHLFLFVKHMKALGPEGKTAGWGRSLRKVVTLWYNQFAGNPQRLAMLVTKYQQREGWSHSDLLRLSHAKPITDLLGFILRYVRHGMQEAKKFYIQDGACDMQDPHFRQIVTYLEAVEEVKTLQTPEPPQKKKTGGKKLKGRDKKRKREAENRQDDSAENGGEMEMEDTDKGREVEMEDAHNGREVEMQDTNKGREVEMEDTDKGREVEMEDTDKGREVEVQDLEKWKEEMENHSAVQRLIALVRQFDLVREHVPTPMLKFRAVWESLLDQMPMMAMMRNLNKMTQVGLLANPDHLHKVLTKMGNAEAIRQSKLHPYSILTAWYMYRGGCSNRGRVKWDPIPEVCDVLEKAFYAAFGNVEATNKRILIALDISPSMDTCYAATPGTYSPLTARTAAAAMSLVTLNVESCVDVVAFSKELIPVPLERGCTLNQALLEVCRFMPGFTDCSLPMVWARENGKLYDAFIVYTDSETYSPVAPVETLRQYRQKSGIENSRLAVVAMSAGEFTLADPEDIYMLDVVGFDTDTPAILQQFIEGSIVE